MALRWKDVWIVLSGQHRRVYSCTLLEKARSHVARRLQKTEDELAIAKAERAILRSQLLRARIRRMREWQ